MKTVVENIDCALMVDNRINRSCICEGINMWVDRRIHSNYHLIKYRRHTSSIQGSMLYHVRLLK